jgi:hypothetical protein
MSAMKYFLPLAAIFALLPLSESAKAYTQCQSNVEKIWAGDGGYIWIHFTSGGSTYLAPNDPNREAVIALSMTALTGSRQVIVRFAADGVSCASTGRSDFVGMYLL